MIYGITKYIGIIKALIFCTLNSRLESLREKGLALQQTIVRNQRQELEVKRDRSSLQDVLQGHEHPLQWKITQKQGLGHHDIVLTELPH